MPTVDPVPMVDPQPTVDAEPKLVPVPMAVAMRDATLEARAGADVPLGMSGPLPAMDLAGVRAWISDLPLQHKGAIITAAAAVLAVAIALTVTVTLG